MDERIKIHLDWRRADDIEGHQVNDLHFNGKMFLTQPRLIGKKN